jgi:hypothetical protein
LRLGAAEPDSARAQTSAPFDLRILDTAILGPWFKTAGDLDGDGRIDLVIGGAERGGLVAYHNRYPNWDREVVDATRTFSTDGEVADIDGDGRNDIVAILLKPAMVGWYRNTPAGWQFNPVVTNTWHDVEVADFDGDGLPDLAGRNQKEWPAGKDDGSILHFCWQTRSGTNIAWTETSLECPPGEGLLVTDLNGDGRPDVVVNQWWFENLGARHWARHRYASDAAWNHPNTFIAAGDINGDGRRDLVLSPSEREGHRYKISWFEAPADPRAEAWAEHLIATNVETVVHFVGVADFDGDGRADVAAAQMTQGADPDDVTLFLNRGAPHAGAWTDTWEPKTLSVDGSHAMRIVDVNGDGRPDLFGANWRANQRDEFVKLWVNRYPPAPRTGSLDRWRRRVIDPAQPWPSVFIAPIDLDGDGRLDIVAGAWWYRNAGKTNAWERHTIGAPFNNFALAADFNGDKRPDLFGTAWIGKRADPRLVWARNEGGGKFTVLTNTALPDGREDFLQGAAFGDYGGPRPEIALSWHAGTGRGIQWLTVPADPSADRWPWRRSAQADQQEQLTAADIDGDGKLDLVLGTRWLRNEAGGWSSRVIAENALQPDRNRVGDINGDGRPDVVVGYLGISSPGRLAWYERSDGATNAWREHIIAEDVIGPMSLDVADMDGDGDLDVVVGEHNLKEPARARLIIFENEGRGERWRRHIVHTGDEHHDGAQVADMDGDGDLDIISIGWGHRQVLLYENLSIP